MRFLSVPVRIIRRRAALPAPLTWKTAKMSSLAGQRNDFEYEVIDRIHAALAPDVAVTLLADRAFRDQKLYGLLQSLGWDFVIQFRGAILVEDAKGSPLRDGPARDAHPLCRPP